VNRNVRLLNQPDNSVKATLIGDGERCINVLAELSKAHDVCQVQFLELIIVGDIEKDGLGALASRQISPTVFRSLARSIASYSISYRLSLLGVSHSSALKSLR
jgi:hypothetical protein